MTAIGTSIVREDESRYVGVLDRKAEGAHYTPGLLAIFVADQIADAFLKTWDGKGIVRVCDPAFGDGELLVAVVQALQKRGVRELDVYGFELNGEALKVAEARLRNECEGFALHLRQDDFLEVVCTEYSAADSPSLFDEPAGLPFDVLIANPPYVRTQVLGASEAQRIGSLFGLTGRVDLYHAFLFGISRVLRPGGVCGVIVSNRFMTTKGGASIREDLLKQFHPLHVFDFGDTKLFSAAVLPAVLLLEKQGERKAEEATRFTSIYSCKDGGEGVRTRNAITALDHAGVVTTNADEQFRVQHGFLEANGVWRLRNDAGDEWLDTVRNHTWSTFGEIGNIRVGVKTTADKVFIGSDWETMPESERPELLRPLTTHHIADRFRAKPPTKGIVYPHVVSGGKRMAAPLSEYPKTKAFLERHRAVLEARKYVTDSGRKWYEIWVPQDPELWSSPKLVFRDISEEPTFWIDLEGTVVNGDCYWLAAPDDKSIALLWLAVAVANSRFIEAFYDRRFNNKLYAGRRRFMTQYVENFPIPDPCRPESKKLVTIAKAIYECTEAKEQGRLGKELNDLVWLAFGLSVEE